MLLACELASRVPVTVIDADPNHPVSTWARRPGRPDNLQIVDNVHQSTIIDAIEEAAEKSTFVVVDLEGTASMTVAYAISRADLVIIPSQGSQLDAAEAAKAVRLIREQEKAFNRNIPFAVLITRTSSAIRPRTLRHIEDEFRAHDVTVLKTQLHERDAYKALFSFGGPLNNLDASQVSGLKAAIANARAYSTDVIALLRQSQPHNKASAMELA
ncbi:MAG: ParA family protein [Acuticoccus sp.]